MKRFLFSVIALVLVVGTALAEGNKIPLIGSKAPSFKAQSTNGKITFPDDFGKSWKILFSHPQDFTPVCSTELLELANLQSKFNELGVKIAIVSTDNIDMHKLWVKYLDEVSYKDHGKVAIKFPLFEDVGGTISKEYGMLHEPTSTVHDIRGVFIIDENNIVRSINFYPMQVGRNMDEIVRIVEALKTTQESMVYTPANWQSGNDVIVPYNPFDKEFDLADMEVKDGYYKVGNRIWFKQAASMVLNDVKN